MRLELEAEAWKILTQKVAFKKIFLLPETPIFESNGLEFQIQFEIINDQFNFVAYFQNRFTGDCQTTINLRHYKKFREEFSFDIRGSEAGRIIVPVTMPNELQGKKILFAIEAKTTYRMDRGEVVRPVRGFATRKPRESVWLGIATIATALAAPIILLFDKDTCGMIFDVPTGLEPVQELLSHQIERYS